MGAEQIKAEIRVITGIADPCCLHEVQLFGIDDDETLNPQGEYSADDKARAN